MLFRPMTRILPVLLPEQRAAVRAALGTFFQSRATRQGSHCQQRFGWRGHGSDPKVMAVRVYAGAVIAPGLESSHGGQMTGPERPATHGGLRPRLRVKVIEYCSG